MHQHINILTATDLHRRKTLYEGLASAVETHHPDIIALVGDFLDAEEPHRGQFTDNECAEFLAQLRCQELVFVRGNHENEHFRGFANAWAKTGRKLNALHGEVFIHGPLALVGFPCLLGEESSYLGRREPLPTDPCEWLPALLRAHGPAMRTLWLMHEPPAGTPLSARAGPMAGNPEWVSAIERFCPWMTISGHDHRSPLINKRWNHKLGQTICVNVGQPDPARLHYCLVEAEFGRSVPSLPGKLKVTAFPLKATVCCPQA
jgi:Icc-related predicted phosphoesterase